MWSIHVGTCSCVHHFRAGFHYYLIPLSFSPKCCMQNYKYFRKKIIVLNAENIVYLWIYINISCIYKNNTANCLKFDQQLLGLTLKVIPFYEIQPWSPIFYHSVLCFSPKDYILSFVDIPLCNSITWRITDLWRCCIYLLYNPFFVVDCASVVWYDPYSVTI